MKITWVDPKDSVTGAIKNVAFTTSTKTYSPYWEYLYHSNSNRAAYAWTTGAK